MPELIVLFQNFGIALGLGMLIGLERERELPVAFAGVRTFPMIAMLGCGAALVNDHFAPWAFGIGLAALTLFVLASYLVTSAAGHPGITTEVAALLAYLFGGLVWWGMVELAAALTVATALLLAAKQPLERISRRIGSDDVRAALQFGVITLIVLPILPDQTYGPFDVLNPRRIWEMVVLIAGINLVGYALVKILGSRQGIGLAGLLGGLASSTATTLGFSRHSREDPGLAPELGLGIVLASTVMFVRVLVEAFTVNSEVGYALLAPITAAGAVGLASVTLLWFRRRQINEVQETEQVEARNPFELWSAITFGLLFGVVLFLSKAAQVTFGAAGVYISSAAAGLADVDAITLSLANLAGGDISVELAVEGITLAALANTGAKAALSAIVGTPAMRRVTLPIFAAMIVTGIIVSFVIT
jgi:uncharacterized membrane protein (DUF4010 family)